MLGTSPPLSVMRATIARKMRGLPKGGNSGQWSRSCPANKRPTRRSLQPCHRASVVLDTWPQTPPQPHGYTRAIRRSQQQVRSLPRFFLQNCRGSAYYFAWVQQGNKVNGACQLRGGHGASLRTLPIPRNIDLGSDRDIQPVATFANSRYPDVPRPLDLLGLLQTRISAVRHARKLFAHVSNFD